MAVKEIWMSRDTSRRSRFGLRTLGGVLAIAALALLLSGGGTVLALSQGWPAAWVALPLCLGVTALTAALALGLGRRSVGDATVFFLTEEDRLFAVDVRRLADCGGSALSLIQGVLETQRLLRRLARQPDLPARADEILKVERIRDNRSHYALICQVRCPHQRVSRRTYFLVKGTERPETLLRQLERREQWSGSPELEESRRPLYLLLSVLACCGFGVLCVLSHPALSRLPRELYFPCLGAAFASLCCAVWQAVRQRRGE